MRLVLLSALAACAPSAASVASSDALEVRSYDLPAGYATRVAARPVPPAPHRRPRRRADRGGPRGRTVRHRPGLRPAGHRGRGPPARLRGDGGPSREHRGRLLGGDGRPRGTTLRRRGDWVRTKTRLLLEPDRTTVLAEVGNIAIDSPLGTLHHRPPARRSVSPEGRAPGLDRRTLEELYVKLERPLYNGVFRWVWNPEEAQELGARGFGA